MGLLGSGPNQVSTNGDLGNMAFQDSASVRVTNILADGAANVSGPLTVSNTTPSTSNTTGALLVSGGLAVAGNTYLTGYTSIGYSATSGSGGLSSSNPFEVYGLGNNSATINLVAMGTGNATTRHYRNNAFKYEVGPGGGGDNWAIYNSGIAGYSIYVNYSGGNITLGTGGGTVTVANTTASTSTTTGSLIVNGGAGIAGNVYIGGTANVSNNLIVTGQVLANNGTALLPGYAFNGATNIGMGILAGSPALVNAGSIAFWNQSAGFGIASNYPITFNSGNGPSLYGEVSGTTIAQRYGTNAQSFRLYNTYTDASNYERLGINWTSNTATITTENLGTGSSRNLVLNGGSLQISAGGTVKAIFYGATFQPNSDNGYDFGVSTYRWKNIYAAGSLSTGSVFISNTTTSTSNTTGALVVAGGVGVTGNVVVGGSIIENGYNVVSQRDIGSALNQIPLNGYLGTMAYQDQKAITVGTVTTSSVISTSNAAVTLASATTIYPNNAIVFVSGTAAIATITVPTAITGGGQITLIPTGIFTTTTGGNIALASTAVVSKALIMTYDSGTTKWYPSY